MECNRTAPVRSISDNAATKDIQRTAHHIECAAADCTRFLFRTCINVSGNFAAVHGERSAYKRTGTAIPRSILDIVRDLTGIQCKGSLHPNTAAGRLSRTDGTVTGYLSAIHRSRNIGVQINAAASYSLVSCNFTIHQSQCAGGRFFLPRSRSANATANAAISRSGSRLIVLDGNVVQRNAVCFIFSTGGKNATATTGCFIFLNH